MDRTAETTSKPAVSFDLFAMSKQGFEIHFQLSGEKAYCHALKALGGHGEGRLQAPPLEAHLHRKGEIRQPQGQRH